MADAPITPRHTSFDLVRGLALLVMGLDHAEEMGGVQALSYLTYAPIGISTGAEAFVLVSGLTLGYAFLPAFQRLGYGALHARCLFRAWQLYILHVLAFVLTAAVIVLVPALLGGARTNQFPQVTSELVTRFALLQANPKYFDILPLYVVILACVPPLFAVIVREPRWALLVSGAVYAGTQVVFLGGSARDLPFWASLYYNPLAWQFLFVIGMTAGIQKRLGRPLPRLSRGAVIAAVLVLVVLGGWYKGARANAVLGWYGDATHAVGRAVPYDVPLTDKRTLGPVRLLHVSLVALLLAQFWPGTLDRWSRTWLRPAVVTGRHSLEVFVVHIPVSYAIGSVMRITGGGRPLVLMLGTAAVLTLVATAYLVEWRKGLLARMSSRAAVAPVPSAVPTEHRPAVSAAVVGNLGD